MAMKNEEILRDQFILEKTYTRSGKSAKYIDTLLRCNSKANPKAIGTIGKISITNRDNIVIVRAPMNAPGVFEITEYRRKPNYHDGETINTER